MSLILEALRKSEAERRRGQVPDLHSERSPAALRVHDGPPAWLWVALALATALVLAMALWLGRGVLPGPPHSMATPADATAVAVAAPIASRSAAVVTAEPVRTVDLFPGRVDRPELMPAPMPERTQAAPSMANTTPARQSPLPAPSLLPAPSSAPGDATVSARKALSVPAPPPPERPAVATPAATVVPTAAASTGVASAELAATPAGSAPRRLSDLAVTERRQLPPLKMSMHMWSPTQRFAIIDGARVAEGDRIGDAVVEAITADGVVLAWQGQRLRLPTR